MYINSALFDPRYYNCREFSLFILIAFPRCSNIVVMCCFLMILLLTFNGRFWWGEWGFRFGDLGFFLFFEWVFVWVVDKWWVIIIWKSFNLIILVNFFIGFISHGLVKFLLQKLFLFLWFLNLFYPFDQVISIFRYAIKCSWSSQWFVNIIFFFGGELFWFFFRIFQ